MGREITIASTTDSQEDVNRAAGLPAEAKEEKEEVQEQAAQGERVPSGESEGEETPETQAESETAQTEEAEGEKDKGADKGKPKGGFQKRIDRLTARNYRLEEMVREQNDRIEALLGRLEKGVAVREEPRIQATSPVTSVPVPEDDPEPMPEQFKDRPYEDYVKALSRWTARQENRVLQENARRQREAETKQSEEQRTRQVFDDYNRKVDEARERYDDWEETINQPDVAIPEAVRLAIFELDNGPDVAYYLGKHPEACEELMEMSPLAAVTRIGAISAALLPEELQNSEEKAASIPQKRAVSSSAPAPITPVGRASTKSSVPLDQMDYRGYRAIRDQQEKSRHH